MDSVLTKQNKRQEFLVSTAIPSLLMALGCLLCSFIGDKSTDQVAFCGLCIFCATVFIFGYMLYAKILTWQRAIFLLFFLGFFLRIAYVIYTGYTIRQHDVWHVDSGKGHMAYIQYIANNLAIPDTNATWQFYHPPLHHILAGLLYRFLDRGGMQDTLIAEKLQFLTAFYSCMTMVVCDRILVNMKLKDSSRFIGLALIVFQPTYMQVGGDLNNDMLATLLATLSVLYMIKWWNDSKIGYIIPCGLFLGLSMMTKLSGAVLAFPFAFLFLWKFIQNIKKPWNLMGQYAAFGFISIPIGMWYPIRNLIKFNQDILYVPGFSTTDNQYIGGYSVLKRLFSFPTAQLTTPYQTWGGSHGNGYNIFLSLFKTSLFGEHEMGGGFWSYLILLVFVLITLAAVYYLLWDGLDIGTIRRNPVHGMWSVLWVSMMISYVLFCIKYPFICSQDFRYLTITLPALAVYFARWFEKTNSKGIRVFLSYLMLLFCVSSYMIYGVPAIWGL